METFFVVNYLAYKWLNRLKKTQTTFGFSNHITIILNNYKNHNLKVCRKTVN